DKIAIKQGGLESITKEHIAAFLDAWVIVDMCHRTREIIQQIPKLPQKAYEIQIFLKSTIEIEKLRNHVQHFRNGIHTIPDKTYPLWGSLSWHPTQGVKANVQRCYLIVAGNLVPGVEAPSCSLDVNVT